MQALLSDSNVARLKADGSSFCRQLTERETLADLLRAADAGDATAQSKLLALTTVSLMLQPHEHIYPVMCAALCLKLWL